MTVSNTIKSDEEITLMFRKGKRSAWEHLYNKYAAVMYGTIMRFIDDEELAEEILIESFIQLKSNSILSTANRPLCLSVLHHTYIIVKRFLRSKGIVLKHDIEIKENFAILNCLVTKPHSLEEIARKAGATNEVAKTKLRAELLQLRNDILLKNSLQ